MSAELTALFDYDLWANRQWADHLASRGWPEPEKAIFEHMLAASTAWVRRLEGDPPTAALTVPYSAETLTQLHGRWVATLADADLDDIVPFRRFNGEEMEASRGDIAKHVANHGTYHRGELRGLCRAAGIDDLPETDLIKFVLTR